MSSATSTAKTGAFDWIAHRGLSAFEPENTLRAFEAAWTQTVTFPISGIEMDLRVTQDGQVMVVHDPNMERVAGQKLKVARTSAAELRRLDVGKGERPPLLDEVLDWRGDKDVTLHLELKGDQAPKTKLVSAFAKSIKRRSTKDQQRIVVSSFFPQILVGIRLSFGKTFPLAFLCDMEHTGFWRSLAILEVLKPDYVHPHHGMLRADLVQRFKSGGYRINTWTIDKGPYLKFAAQLGVDGIITNDPADAQKRLAAMFDAEPGLDV